MSLDPGTAEAVPCVDRDPEHLDTGAELHDRPGIRTVDRRRVPAPGDSQYGTGGVDAAAAVRHPDQPEYRAQLFVRERFFGHHQGERREQDAGGAWHAQPGLARDPGRVLADEADVELPAGEQQRGYFGRLVRLQQVGTLALEVAQQRVGDRVLHDQHRLVRAQDRVVEALAVHDSLGRFRQV